MKKLALCSAVALVSQNAAADVEPHFYAGFNLYGGYGAEHVDRKEAGIKSNTKDEFDTRGISIRAGYIFPSDNRFEISANRINADFEERSNAEFTGVDFDWKFTGRKDVITPYMGVGLGLYRSKSLNPASNINVDGVSFNVSCGLLFEPYENFEMDFGIISKEILWQEKEYDGDFGGNYKFNSTSSIFYYQLGISYLF